MTVDLTFNNFTDTTSQQLASIDCTPAFALKFGGSARNGGYAMLQFTENGKLSIANTIASLALNGRFIESVPVLFQTNTN